MALGHSTSTLASLIVVDRKLSLIRSNLHAIGTLLPCDFLLSLLLFEDTADLPYVYSAPHCGPKVFSISSLISLVESEDQTF